MVASIGFGLFGLVLGGAVVTVPPGLIDPTQPVNPQTERDDDWADHDAPPSARAVVVFEDVSSDVLPLACTQGRTMDAEFADLDDDGDLDLVLASEFGQNVVLSNNGEWFTYRSLSLPQGALHDSEDIAIFDADEDGKPDLCFVSEDDRVNEFYLATRGGEFESTPDRLPVAGTSNAVLAADLTGDGHADLIIGNAGQNTMLVNGGPTARYAFEDETIDRLPIHGGTTQDLELGDIDGDGDLDLIVANEDGNRILINDGTGVFADETDARYPGAALGVVETREADLGDLDGDGDLDLVLANVGWRPGANPTNRVLLNDGAGVFTDATPDALPANTQPFFSLDIDLADIDADGDLDQLIANVNGPFQILLNDGNAKFTPAPAAMLPEVAGPFALIDVEAADVNQDGFIDLYLANHMGPDRLWLGRG